MRMNTEVEMEFQAEIQNTFIKYDEKVGFNVMIDILLAWMVSNIISRKQISKWGFLACVNKTWNDCKKVS